MHLSHPPPPEQEAGALYVELPGGLGGAVAQDAARPPVPGDHLLARAEVQHRPRLAGPHRLPRRRVRHLDTVLSQIHSNHHLHPQPHRAPVHDVPPHVQVEGDGHPESAGEQGQEGVRVTEQPDHGRGVQRRLLQPHDDEAEAVAPQPPGGHLVREEGAGGGGEAAAQHHHQVGLPAQGLRPLQEITSRLVTTFYYGVRRIKPGSTILS